MACLLFCFEYSSQFSSRVKPKIPSTNKNFLRNTLVSTLRHPYTGNKHGDFSKYKKSHSLVSDGKQPNDVLDQCTSKSTGRTSEQGSLNADRADDDHKYNNDKKRRRSSPMRYIYDAYDYKCDTSSDLVHSRKERRRKLYKNSAVKGNRRKKKSSESSDSHDSLKRKKKHSKKHKSCHHKKKKSKSKI